MAVRALAWGLIEAAYMEEGAAHEIGTFTTHAALTAPAMHASPLAFMHGSS